MAGVAYDEWAVSAEPDDHHAPGGLRRDPIVTLIIRRRTAFGRVHAHDIGMGWVRGRVLGMRPAAALRMPAFLPKVRGTTGTGGRCSEHRWEGKS
jgi:hypothetical protein